MKSIAKLLCVLLWVVCCGWSMANADEQAIPVPADLPSPVFEAPPRLAITQSEFAKLKAQPDFATKRDAAIKAGEALLAAPVQLPDNFAEWIFYYACADDGTPLKALNPQEHQCPKCGKIFTDERTRAAYRTTLHYACEAATQTLGWAYLYSGDERFAVEVKRILLTLAAQYPSYPPRHDRWGGKGEDARWGGRRYVQSLDEGVGIIKLAKGYDLTRTAATWTPSEKTLVERDLFGLTAQTLLHFNQDINNHQTWYNAGLMAIASVCGDAALVNKVLTMRGGYYDQLNRSLGRDGLWYEGAMVYHAYALQAMREIVDAGRRLHLPLHKEPKLRAMLLGPINAAYPNGAFPVINDSDPVNINIFNDDFAWAREVFQEPGFATTKASTQSIDLPDAGLAILRQGEGEGANSVFLDYGLHGAGHGHFDKLNITLYANGREWLLDPGRIGYNHKEYLSWAKHTAAHNTVSLGGKNQRPTLGRLLWLQNGEGFSAAAAESDGAYLDSVLRRYLLLTPGFLADVFEVEGNEVQQTDWLTHAVAAALKPVDELGASVSQSPGSEFGYQHYTEVQKWDTAKTTQWDFLADDKKPDALRLRMWILDNEPQELFSTFGIGNSVNQKTPTLIRRRSVKNTRFVTLYDLSGQGNGIVAAKWDGKTLVVQTPQGNREIVFSPAGVTVK